MKVNFSNVVKRDVLYLNVLNTDRLNIESIIGEVRFPLDQLENQEEYDILLEIPDEEDDEIINAKVNAKIQFIWSPFKMYQDLHAKSEKIINTYNNMIAKSNHLLQNLSGTL